MREIGEKFYQYSLLFPEQAISLNEELNQIEIQIEAQFDQDLKTIRKVINDKRIPVKINFRLFTHTNYLHKVSLYTKIPQSLGDIIRFYLANLHICKEVLLSIVSYIRYPLLRRIEISHQQYVRRESNVLIQVFNEFIGCCRNAEKVLSDYMVFLRQIEIKIGSITQGVTQLSLPFRHEDLLSILLQ
jgi:hypothetical protein